jgi:putative zinc finger/helix-turn-helix YgiT family protein
MTSSNLSEWLPSPTCPNCGSDRVVTDFETDHFKYGDGADAVELSARVLVSSCQNCQFEFTDGNADDGRQLAIRRHLGLLSPDEIGTIRKRCARTRKEFAKTTRIGEASLARWENGQLLQSAALDNYLFLLTHPENYGRLKNRAVQSAVAAVEMTNPADCPTFRSINRGSPDLQRRAAAFCLTPP